MLPAHIKSASDLVTSHRATVEGVIDQALEKNRLAVPYVEEAKRFSAALDDAAGIDSLMREEKLRDVLLAAAGLSDKAIKQLSTAERDASLRRVLQLVTRNGGADWREHLLYRFLLTRGDSLGGSMRNVTGALAGRRLVAAISAALARDGVQPMVKRTAKGKVTSMAWSNRLLLFDKTPDFVSNNIDAVLLNVNDDQADAGEFIERPECFLACGELKGGIDPAGADEHWKTANSALGRIRKAFRFRGGIDLFFVAAAIEDAMAREIFAQLKDGRLSFAANLTVDKQLEDLADWIAGL